VDANQEVAIRFYRGLSFSETGKMLKRYYPNGDDAVEMVRELRDDG
jgi:ribosomal protein S18 acetylase RimI-like enzyme